MDGAGFAAGSATRARSRSQAPDRCGLAQQCAMPGLRVAEGGLAAADPGCRVLKRRSRAGQGKSGGFRTLIIF